MQCFKYNDKELVELGGVSDVVANQVSQVSQFPSNSEA